jgi:adenine-specific DNA-methyltransferase
MEHRGKLELTWVGKYDDKVIEPRILVEDIEKSYGDPISENMLIHGDNLIALQALQQDFAGRIKCIYIDPPYNTGSAFEHYNDNLEHSIWLDLMSKRLILLRDLLDDDGGICVQIDAVEMPYLKVIMDEIFQRRNFVNIVCVKTKIAGVSGSNLGKSLQDNVEFIMIYAKDISNFSLKMIPQKNKELIDYIDEYIEQGKSWKYTSVLKTIDDGSYVKSFKAGNGDEIKLFVHKKFEIKSINQIANDEFDGDTKKAYYSYINKVFRTTNAQTSIRTKVIKETKEFNNKGIFSIEYIPIKGKNAGQVTRFYYKNTNLIAWLKDVVRIQKNSITKLDNMGNLWDDIQYNNLTKEGSVQFPNGKKPEALIRRFIEMLSEPGDYVLDSFLGSGTTVAVAHKLRRKWIGVELGNQCYSHCKPRLDRVINGEDSGGISKDLEWIGGGGYHFYELAPSLLTKNSKLPIYQINPDYTYEMLCEAICKIEGFRYQPSGTYHGHSSEKRFIHVTIEFVNAEYIRSVSSTLGDDQSLLIYGTKIQSDLRLPNNIEVKRIPKDLLTKCDYESEVR